LSFKQARSSRTLPGSQGLFAAATKATSTFPALGQDDKQTNEQNQQKPNYLELVAAPTSPAAV